MKWIEADGETETKLFSTSIYPVPGAPFTPITRMNVMIPFDHPK